LLGQVANGDKAAFRELYALAGGKLFAICLRMMKSRNEAEDVFQDAFVKIWEKSWQFDPAKGDGMAWMATITRHAALDRLRTQKQIHVSIDDDVTEEIDKAMSVTPQFAGESRDLQRCLGTLREDYRNIVVMAYVKGMSHEELCAAFNKPLGTIKTWASRGLAQLKDCMQS
jgi:RNA polymerase sigma-70 factor, ECF subfamily